MANIEELKQQRKTLKSSLTRIYNYCRQDNVQVEEVQVRAEKADNLFENYEQIQNQIDNVQQNDVERAQEEQYRSDIENTFFSIKAIYYKLKEDNNIQAVTPQVTQDNNQLTDAVQALIHHQTSMNVLMERFATNMGSENTSTTMTNEHSHQPTELSLPRIQLPEFDGNLLEWIRFKELFEALIHNRNSLANVEKLEYLQSKLKGEALIVIKHLKPSNNNYLVAWELLNKKYDNKEKVKGAYMELLFEQPAMKSSSLHETKRLYNSTNEAFNALKALDDNVNQWDSVLLFNIEKKLDNSTATLWYREKNHEEATTFNQLLRFIEKRIFELECMHNNHQQEHTAKQQRGTPSRTYTTTLNSCPICSIEHYLFQCGEFKKMGVDQRRNIVHKYNICFNCLHRNHKAYECKSSSCKNCGRKHHTLLHKSITSEPVQRSNIGENEIKSPFTPEQIVPTVKNNQNKETSNFVSSNSSQSKQWSYVILPTAIIAITDVNGSKQKCRALLDSGSQGTLITEDCVQRLGIKRQYDKTVIYGLGNNEGNQTKGKVQLKISALDGNDFKQVEALCLKKLTQIIPGQKIDKQNFEYFKNLKLADPYLNVPAKIDLIIGADIFMECCLPEKEVHPTGSPIALNTIFGWILMGHTNATTNCIQSNHVSLELDQLLKQFWEIEELQTTVTPFSPDEEKCEQIFTSTTKRDDKGRFVVKLPMKSDKIDVGESKSNAVKRLYAMERKFNLQPQIKTDYHNFMREYIDLGHMQTIDPTEHQYINYLPHHAVLKPTSTTTKLRVVFDASCKTSNGKSLNDNLLIGSKVQRDLFDIIITFRMYAVAFTGDIEKMYRQVMIHEDDRRWQCILWRNCESEEIKTYCLNTVTYGTAPAAFLATRALQQIAYENSALHETAAEAINQNFYVDDFMCSVQHLQEAIRLKNDVSSLLKNYGFNIRKWAANSTKFFYTVPLQDQATAHPEIKHTPIVSTLGLLWDTEKDVFKYSTASFRKQQELTKRAVLSNVARIYDPLGWIAPVVVRFKIFMQKLWLAGLNWDEQIPTSMSVEWTEIYNNIDAISHININRWFNFTDGSECELHGFADASEMAYAAAVYIKVNLGNNRSVSHLLAAKTRVAPVKQVSLPRLELCAAHLLVKLMVKIRKSLKMNDIIMHAWSDSMIVLAWLSDHPRRWSSFVGNRTSQIISIISANQWHHIKSQSNPADLATRGVFPMQLINNELWWHGPNELFAEYPLFRIERVNCTDCDLEERKGLVVNSCPIEDCSFIGRYSNLAQLIRTTALVLRFVYNCQNKHQKHIGFLTVSELRMAHAAIVKISQKSSFKEEINILTAGHQLPTKNRLTSLAPFLDENGVMRVGGRLVNANINYEQKHPIILSGKQELSKLIVRQYHIQNCHANKRLLYYLIHLKYWITSAAQMIKEVIYKCPTCMRYRAKPMQQQMGNLPSHRLIPTPVFTNVGIDFAGPVQVLAWKGRGNKLYKCWISIFVCLVTKAVHIELVSELTTTAFIATLRRFIARRGRPENIYTDNGTNFMGANNYLTELYKFLKITSHQHAINAFLANQEIQWHFSPPAGPHFGGIWEAGVKVVKRHLNRVLKNAHPTFEEMSTVLCQIEMCLNSRPLCIKFEGDVDPLTPAHFILLRPMTTIPDEDKLDIKDNYLTRWQYVQRLVQQFWKKWSTEYLHQMQQRPKWKRKQENIEEGDIVVIKDENLAPTNWAMGKVIRLHRGTDGLARVAIVKTAWGELKRPIIKLCPILINC